MSVIYFPNRVYRGNDKVPSIDRVMAKRSVKTATGTRDLSAANLSTIVSCDNQWQIDSIAWIFNNVAAKDFSATITNGIRIVSNLNDYLWIHVDVAAPQRVVLDPGFYTGTQLASHLQSELDALPAYSAIPITFTVSYTAATGLFLISPSSGSIKYLSVNTTQPLSIRDSIAGHLFGFTTTTPSFSTNVSSNTSVYGLDSSYTIVSLADSAATSYVHSGLEVLTMDQALTLAANSGSNVTTNYIVTYEEIV